MERLAPDRTLLAVMVELQDSNWGLSAPEPVLYCAPSSLSQGHLGQNRPISAKRRKGPLTGY